MRDERLHFNAPTLYLDKQPYFLKRRGELDTMPKILPSGVTTKAFVVVEAYAPCWSRSNGQ